MKLESQVTSLETSKKLKELGVKQNSLHWWARSREGVNVPLENCIWSEWELYNFYAEDVRIDDGETPREEVSISAFTASELAEMLPVTIRFDNRVYFLGIKKDSQGDGYWAYYATSDGKPGHTLELFIRDTLVEALAACLIHLIENKLITL